MPRKYAFSLPSTLLLSAVLTVACKPDEGATDTAATDTAATDSDTGDTSAATEGTGDLPTTTAATDATAATETTADTGSTETVTATDATATDATASTVGETVGETDTEGETDTGAVTCPEAGPPLPAGIDNLDVALLSATTADCAVEAASNTAGKVSLSLLCSNDVDLDVPVTIDLSVPDDFKVDFAGVDNVRLDYHTEDWEPPIAWFALHDLATDALVLAALENYPANDLAFAPLTFDPVDSCGGACQSFYTYSFTHADGPALDLFHQSRGTLSATGRDYDVVLSSAWSDNCEEHSGSLRWVIGSAAP